MRLIKDLPLAGRTVFIRLDLNVPLERHEDGTVTVTDDTRIREVLPTLQFARESQARVILASHLGRPDGKRDTRFSLEPVAQRLAVLLEDEVLLAEEAVGEGVELMVSTLRPGQVLLLENLRFYPGEEANQDAFVSKLCRLAEVYINDAFGACHRKHASTFGMPASGLIPDCGIGLLIEKELRFLAPLLEKPEQPFVTLLGGSKVSDKIKTIQNLMKSSSSILIGGAMGHAFWLATGKSLPEGARLPSNVEVEAAKQVLEVASERKVRVEIPVDTVDGFDIGPKTVELFKSVLAGAKTVFWNGPLGWFERLPYQASTFEIAAFLAQSDATCITGGGDTVAAVHASGQAEHFAHLSTGGGAVLTFLEGNPLPGLQVLSEREFASPKPLFRGGE
jgi:phosphoglycerate kinase